MTTHPSMPLRGALLIAAAITSLFSLSAVAQAASVPVELRVVDSSGIVLGDYIQYTDSVSLKTDTKATCFGQGTGGSGDNVTIAGKTALGAVVDGSLAGDRDLKPVSVTDTFDFGLGVCGIGGEVAPATGFWYLKQDNAASQLGGDATKVKKDDQITWFLDSDFADAPPAELVLEAPSRVEFETPTDVQVFEYADDGTRTPAAGVEVTGASQPTDETGSTSISLTVANQTLTATRAGAISDESQICASSKVSDCPKSAGSIIGGSSKEDEIKGTKGPDSINAGAGDDEVDAQDGQRDQINCGSGKNKVEADREDEIAKNCQKVRF